MPIYSLFLFETQPNFEQASLYIDAGRELTSPP